MSSSDSSVGRTGPAFSSSTTARPGFSGADWKDPDPDGKLASPGHSEGSVAPLVFTTLTSPPDHAEQQLHSPPFSQSSHGKADRSQENGANIVHGVANGAFSTQSHGQAFVRSDEGRQEMSTSVAKEAYSELKSSKPTVEQSTAKDTVVVRTGVPYSSVTKQ